MKEIINKIGEIYCHAAGWLIAIIVLLMGIFGGEFKLQINFDSLKGLIEAIKNYRK